MKKLTVLAIAVFLVLTLLVWSQTRNPKPPPAAQNEPSDANQNKPPNANPVSSQDPFTVAPQAYKRAFENERVRVTRVRYEAREVIKSHDHPNLPTVYVYLSDSGPVRFIHTGDEEFINTRPAVTAGGFRLARPAVETHEVESLSDQPSDFLRIELKDLTVDRDTFRGRFPPESNQNAQTAEKIGFENRQMRVVRLTCAAGKTCKVSAQTSAYLLVALTASQLKMAAGGGDSSDLEMDAGQTMWVESGKQLDLENQGKAPIRFLRIELKAAP